MTISEYREQYGTEFRILAEKPVFAAFLQTLRDAHPLHAIKKRKDGDRIHGAVAFLNEIKGYDDCLENIENILLPPLPEAKERPATYEEEEIQVPPEE